MIRLPSRSTLLGVAVSLVVLVSPSAIAQDEPPCSFWEFFDTDGRLDDVIAHGPDEAWAVGMISPPNDPGTSFTLVYQWDGQTWERVPSPSPAEPASSDPRARLFAVDGIPGGVAWAVGHYLAIHDDTGFVGPQTLALRWDGDEWEVVPSPQTPPGGTGSFYTDVQVLAEDDVWASGFRASPDAGAITAAFVHQWDGSSWTEFLLPRLSGNENEANAFHVFSHDEIVVVGAHTGPGNGPPRFPFVARWDGSDWSFDDVPDPATTPGTVIQDLTVLAPDDMWAVGQTRIGAATQPYILHWDGSSWTLVEEDGFDSYYGRLLAVDAVEPDRVFAVGVYIPQQGDANRRLFLAGDGEEFTQEFEDPDAPWNDTLWGAAAIPGTTRAWAVGHGIFRSCEQSSSLFGEDFESGTMGGFVPR